MSTTPVTATCRRRFAALVIVLVGVLGATAAVAQAQTPPEVVEYYATDALGSVRIVFNASGQVLGRSDYLPFGDTLTQSGALPRQRFTGQERDGEAGLDYFNARNLQARTGRMNAPDPLSRRVGRNPQFWNRYAYAPNTRGTCTISRLHPHPDACSRRPYPRSLADTGRLVRQRWRTQPHAMRRRPPPPFLDWHTRWPGGSEVDRSALV